MKKRTQLTVIIGDRFYRMAIGGTLPSDLGCFKPGSKATKFLFNVEDKWCGVETDKGEEVTFQNIPYFVTEEK